jgi:hypothetical protein
MALRLIQLHDGHGAPLLAAEGEEGGARRIREFETAVSLAEFAIDQGLSLAAAVEASLGDEMVDLAAAQSEGRLLPAIIHRDPARIHVTGTGLTHLGSAESRDRMHQAAAGGTVTDSMRMFLMGVEGGKPQGSGPGVQPEWFYKGDGSCIVGPGADLESPDFALDGGEEPEIAGVYLIDRDGNPRRLGFVLANEFSDHVTERTNYLWLAHSKLRPAAIGAELLTGDLPQHIRGTSRIIRGGETIWEQPFLSGEANMSHSLANLEHHHFKYGLCRRPGDIHVHCLGTATLSFADEVTARQGDLFEIEADCFRLPLRNRLAALAPAKFEVTAL